MKATRNTPSKTAILDLITHSKVALSHTEIQKLIGDLCDRVTIYRILDRLVNEDLIHKIAIPDGTVKYASCHHHHHNEEHHTHNHAHFSCEICQTVTCMDTIEPYYKIPDNYFVKQVNFTLSGLCPNCIGPV